MDVYGLEGKRAIITGASRGLGQLCAKAFAAQGVRLLLAARSQDRLEKIKESLKSSNEHVVYAGDLIKPSGIRGLVKAAKTFGEVDIVIHAMGGGLGMRNPLLSWEELDVLFKTNLASAVEINRMIVPEMVNRETGNIVLVGSVASTEAVGSVGYNAIKAALAAYTRSLGRELAETGVVVTGILPGGFWAPDNSFVRFQKRDPELLEKLIAEKQPRKKMGDAEAEIIPLMLFLASRQATMMTGCCVPIDGGEGFAYLQ